MKYSIKIISAAAIALIPFSAFAQSAPPAFNDIFTDNAVFADNSDIILRGTAPPAAALFIKIDNNDFKINSNKNGEWEYKLNTTDLKQIASISVLGENGQGQTIKNISIGKVFLCSGQSNMEFKLKYSTNAEWEIASSGNENVWFINIPREPSVSPKSNYTNKPKWQKADNFNAGETSAVCYYAAREIANRQNVKVGIINASWGGSRIEPWFKRENLVSLGGFESELKLLDEYKKSQKSATENFYKAQYQAWNEIDKGTKESWQNPDLNDEDWREIETSKSWEESQFEELKGFDGVIWFRKNFVINDISTQDAILTLGKIDDRDEVYINGHAIGATNDWNTMREYKFPSNILKPGTNSIAIRIIDTGGGGGFWGNTPKSLSIGKIKYEIDNLFKFKIGGELDRTKIKRIVPWGETNGVTTLYNGMIAPLKDYSLSAFLWYQGESNVGEAKSYQKLLTDFVAQQRKEFKNPTLPFIMSGLSAYGSMNNGTQNSEWAKLRDTQLKVSNSIDRVYLAPSLDVGDAYDIHPPQKRIIGQRMAMAIENYLFSKQNPIGPFPKSAKIRGKDIIIEFTDTGGGLKSVSSDTAIGFVGCDKMGKTCKNLSGIIDGNTISLVDGANNFEIVRYSWSDAPIVNLFGMNGNSISSFELEVDNKVE